MDVTELGIITEVKLQLLKAQSPMEVTESPITTVLIEDRYLYHGVGLS